MLKPSSNNFLALDGEFCDIKTAKFAVVPVPYERTVSYFGGTKLGPSAILEASSQVEFFDEETKTETFRQGIATFKDIDCEGSEEEVFTRIENFVKNYIATYKQFPFYLGGEHSISQALIAPYIEKYGTKLSVLHFDAHADLRKEYYGDERSHACALYPASRKVRVVQVGIRSIGLEEKDNVNAGNVKTFLMHENLDQKKLIKDVLDNLTDTVYITIDVDGFDPSVIPGTGTPQPGGFMWYDALNLFREVIKHKKIVAADVVETAPMKTNPISEFNAAKLIYRLMGYLTLKEQEKLK